MKKIVWIGAGVAVVVGALWLSWDRKPETKGNVSELSADGGDMPQALDRPDMAGLSESLDPEDRESVAEPVKSASVSSSVQVLVHPDSDYQTRLKAMRALGYEIPPQDVTALMEFLGADTPNDTKLEPLAYNSIKNDALELLLRQKKLPDGVGTLLVGVATNSAQSATWRNYCIQFMPEYYDRAVTDGDLTTKGSEAHKGSDVAGDKNQSAVELTAIQTVLWDSLADRSNSNAGTALLGLDKLSRNHPEFSKEEISAAMLDLAADETATLGNRVTALRLCGERGNIQALETARDLAQNGDSTMIRCAAIATLGELGDDEDLALLEAYADSSDRRIKQIAQTALSKRGEENRSDASY